MSHHIDGVKFAGGSFALFPEDKLRELIQLTHENDAYVSTVSKSEPWLSFETSYKQGKTAPLG